MLSGEVYAALVPFLGGGKHWSIIQPFFFFLSDTAKCKFSHAALAEIWQIMLKRLFYIHLLHLWFCRVNNYKSFLFSSFFGKYLLPLSRKRNSLISSQVKLFNDGLILKQLQMTFALSGDVRTGFEAFMYSICILVSIFFNGRSALKEVCSIYNAETVFCF